MRELLVEFVELALREDVPAEQEVDALCKAEMQERPERFPGAHEVLPGSPEDLVVSY